MRQPWPRVDRRARRSTSAWPCVLGKKAAEAAYPPVLQLRSAAWRQERCVNHSYKFTLL